MPTSSTAGLRFAGYRPETFAWFAGIAADNSKHWFSANRDIYDGAVRGPLEAMLEELADELGGHVRIFRQNRDVRFSTDKSPYKTTTYGVIVDRPSSRASLYAQLSAAGLFAGTGYHQLASDQLARFRDAVVDDATGPALERALTAAQAAKVETWGEELKTAPRGYPRDHPRIALLRHKRLVAGRRKAPGVRGIGRATALEHCHATWAACAPMTAWLDGHVGISTLSSDNRRRS